ncbi:hypothetical protein GF382_02775 [Candidatus Falkowbacteria bacterium]|nr:hypothetical protein [Candidatus Falkowbacteria bacterium]
MKKIIRIFIVLLAIFLAYKFHFDIYLSEAGIITVGESGDLNKVIDELGPGNTLVVRSGVYRVPFWSIADLHGTAEAPITIKAQGKVIIEGFSKAFNVLEMRDVSYVDLEGFEIKSSAQTLSGIDGVHISGHLSHNINFRNLKIHDVSGRGLRVSALEAHDLSIADSEIFNCEATAIVFGYPDKYVVYNSEIKNNYIHHCPKDGYRRGYYGIQIREGSFGNAIDNNVMHDIGSHNKAGINVYYGPGAGAGDAAGKANIVRDNILWNGRNQGVAVISDAVIENNIIFNTDIGLALMDYFENSAVGASAIENLVVKNNIIFSCPETGVHVYDWSEADDSVVFSDNLIYQPGASDLAVRGSAGAGRFENNFYFGQCEIEEGFDLARGDFDFAKAFSFTKDPKIGMTDSLQDSLSQAVGRAKTMPRGGDVEAAEEAGLLKSDFEIRVMADAGEIFIDEETISLSQPETAVYDKILAKAGEVDKQTSRYLARFIGKGTLTTAYLGAGERAGVIDSYFNAFGRLPLAEEQWRDVIKIANGRWPTERNLNLEEKTKEMFAEIYGREPDMSYPNDSTAVVIMSYGLRPANRNTVSEKAAIDAFEYTYGRGPASAQDWNIVRAIAYSGASR